MEDRKDARAAGQFGPAVRADELMGKHFAMFTDVNKNVDVVDIPVEDAITELCTQNGVVHESARRIFMHGLQVLKTPFNPDTPPAPTQPNPEAIH